MRSDFCAPVLQRAARDPKLLDDFRWEKHVRFQSVKQLLVARHMHFPFGASIHANSTHGRVELRTAAKCNVVAHHGPARTERKKVVNPSNGLVRRKLLCELKQ